MVWKQISHNTLCIFAMHMYWSKISKQCLASILPFKTFFCSSSGLKWITWATLKILTLRFILEKFPSGDRQKVHRLLLLLLVVLVNLFIQRLMNVMLSGKIWEFNTQPRKSVYHLIFTVSRVSRILAQNNHLAQCKKDEQNIVRERLSNVMLHLWTKIDWSNA